MSDTLRAAVAAALERFAIAYSVTGGNRHQRERMGADGKPWDCFQWRTTFAKSGAACSFDYFTGLAHVVKPKHPSMNDRNHWMYREPRPAVPDAAGVLYSLILDSRAAQLSFRDWCAEFGYSDDSLSAFDTYRACCDADSKLSAVFTRAQRAELAALLEDY